MREKNSERPDTRDNRSKNSTKTGKKKKNTKNQEFAVITYSFLALFICLMGYFSYFQFFKSEEFINNPYNTRQETFAQKIVRGQILTNDGQVLAETVTDSEGNETRRYPYGSIFSHIVGYSTKGKSGLESLANFNLLRSNTAFIDKVGDEMQGEKSPGDNVVTTLDYGLQATAYDALGYYKGAIVVLEPSTGKILAMVSKPDFDPNTIAADWDNLTADDNTDAALLNRATQGLYPPGSTFKILTTLEYIQEHTDYENYSYTCTGSYTVGNHTIHCYGNKSHGTQNLRQAFANSCNGAFAEIGMQINSEKFRALANQMLFNSELPYTLPYNQSTFSLDGSSDDWEKLQTAIGQGKTQITPLHNLMIVSAIANGGTLMKPYMIDHVENVGGQTVKKFLPSAYGTLMSANDAQFLTHLMSQVVEIGTGSAMRGTSYTVAGKTGSAEFETGKETHSWFVGFAPADKPKVAICVLAEESGSGGAVAAPIARQVLDRYFAK